MTDDGLHNAATDLQARAEQRRARQVQACEDFKSKADPWPEEVAS